MFAYVPPEAGESGFAIATGRFLGLLSSQWTSEFVFEAFELLDSADATLSSALALFANADLEGSFALTEVVDSDAHTVSIAVRGDIVVDLGSATTSRFSWPDGATWLVGEGHGVESLRMTLGSAGARAETHVTSLPLTGGVVRAIEASTMLGERHEKAPSPRQNDDRATAGTSEIPQLSSALASHAAGAPPPEVSHHPLPVATHAHASDLSWTLQLPDGNELDAAPQIVVGRRPWRTDPHETSTYYVVAPSPRKEISGKHVEFAIVDNELCARDLGSTNGTLVFAHDRPPRLLHEGRAVRLDIGDTLDLGEGFRIVVGARS